MKRKLSMGLILVTVMLLALAASPVFGGNGDDGLEKAKEAQERHTARLLAIDGVEGTAVGHGPNGGGGAGPYRHTRR